MLRLQLATLETKPGFKRLKEQVQGIAASLEESSSIPVIKEQLGLLQDLQTEGWWEDVTLPMLETVRLRLRPLVKLVEHRKGSPVFTDFTEEMGEEVGYELPEFTGIASFERFREKARISQGTLG